MIKQILGNHILIITISAWLLAQTMKVLLGVLREKRFDFRWFIGTGGMPSSHTAGASALSTAVGMAQGFDSTYFALAAAFAIVVIFDAQGVRRASGRQAKVLNQMMADIYFRGKIHESHLRELIGHTPVEVFVGILFGIFLAILMY